MSGCRVWLLAGLAMVGFWGCLLINAVAPSLLVRGPAIVMDAYPLYKFAQIVVGVWGLIVGVGGLLYAYHRRRESKERPEDQGALESNVVSPTANR